LCCWGVGSFAWKTRLIKGSISLFCLAIRHAAESKISSTKGLETPLSS
jgi:hypothetical protein